MSVDDYKTDEENIDKKSISYATIKGNAKTFDLESVDKTREIISYILNCEDLVTDKNIPIAFKDLSELCSKESFNPNIDDFFESQFFDMMISIKQEIPFGITQSYFNILDKLSSKYNKVARFLADNDIQHVCYDYIHSEECLDSIIKSCFNIMTNILQYMNERDVAEMPIATEQIIKHINDSLQMFLSLISFHGKEDAIREIIPNIILIIAENINIDINTPNSTIQTLASIVYEVISIDPAEHILYVLRHPDLSNIEQNLFNIVFLNTGFDDIRLKIILLKCIGYAFTENKCIDDDFICYIKERITVEWIYDCLMITSDETESQLEEEEQNDETDQLFGRENPLNDLDDGEKEELIKQLILSSLFCLRQLATRSEFDEDFSNYLNPNDFKGLLDMFAILPSKGKEYLMLFLFKLCSLVSDPNCFVFCFDNSIIEYIVQIAEVSPELTTKMAAFIYILMKKLIQIDYTAQVLDKLRDLEFLSLLEEQEFDDDENEKFVKSVHDYLLKLQESP